MDDDNVIYWNLRGPKRMKTRKELNALLKRNRKFFNCSSQSKHQQQQQPASSSINLLKHQSSSSEDFYFAGNKSIINSQRRRNFYRICECVSFISLILICLLINVSIIYWNLKFKENLQKLKDDQNADHSTLQKKSDSIDQLVKDNSVLKEKFEEILLKQKALATNQTSNFDYQKTINDLKQLNDTLEKYSNQMKISNLNLINEINYLKVFLNESLNNRSSILNDEYKNELIKIHNLVDGLQSKISPSLEASINILIQQKFDEFKNTFQNKIENLYINPIVESLSNCNCETDVKSGSNK